MPDQPIRRANYVPPDIGFDCVNDGRAIDADFNRYHMPLAELHNRALHGAGVAVGLDVEGSVGASSLSLKPGSAIDAQGRMIVLPPGGSAGLAVGDADPGFVTYADALPIPIAGPAGSFVLTLGFHEELINENLDVAPCKSYEQRPVARVRPAGAIPELEVVLASFDVDANGKLTGLAAGERAAVEMRVGTIPAGAIFPYAGAAPPNGWLLCDGSEIDPAAQPRLQKLAQVLGTRFDPNGAKVLLPNMTGRTPIGTSPGHALGSVGGQETHALAVEELPSHSHALSDPGHSHRILNPAPPHGGLDPWFGTVDALVTEPGHGSWGPSGPGRKVGIAPSKTGMGIAPTGSGQAHNNMQPFAVLNFIIKF